MNSDPILLNSATDPGTRLARIDAKPGDPKDEQWLQELLYRHPEVLPVDECDDLFAPAIPIGREVQTGRGPLDNLYISPAGNLTIVETKLWKNPERHRTVVAQIIDYAKELATWDYDDLCEAVLASSRRRKETVDLSLEDKVQPTLQANSVTLLDFQESVLSNLREGNFLLLIVGDRVSPNIALLTEAIHSSPGLGFKLGLVEMRLYPFQSNTDWPIVVVPDVVGRTVEKLRGVVRVRYAQEKPDVSVEIDDEEKHSEHIGKIDLEVFLSEIPTDLVQPFREAVEKWQTLGGKIDFTSKLIYFTMDLNGETRRVIPCHTIQVRMVNRKRFASWCQDETLYEDYLKDLERSSVAANLIRSDKQYVRYDKLGPDDLRVVLEAAMELADRIKKAEDAE